MDKSIPILFSLPMVEAILARRKSMTRRVLNVPETVIGFNTTVIHTGVITPVFNGDFVTAPWSYKEIVCPFGKVGDLLWVREAYYAHGEWVDNGHSEFGKKQWKFVDNTLKSDFSYGYENKKPKTIQESRWNGIGWYKRSALFMPKKAARIFLEITDIRVERLHDISDEDCIAEGLTTFGNDEIGYLNPKQAFVALWTILHGPGAYGANPWVWVIEFKRKEVVDG